MRLRSQLRTRGSGWVETSAPREGFRRWLLIPCCTAAVKRFLCVAQFSRRIRPITGMWSAGGATIGLARQVFTIAQGGLAHAKVFPGHLRVA